MAPRPKNDRSRQRRRTTSGPRKRSRHLDGVTTIDIGDHEFLRQFVTEHGKIIPARLSGASARQQRAIRHGICRARVMGLIP